MSFLFEKLTREECEAIREADGSDKGYKQGKADDCPALLPVLAAHNYIHWRATARLCFRSSPHTITYTGERLPGSASGPRRTQLHTLTHRE